jgi:hypothetical protein
VIVNRSLGTPQEATMCETVCVPEAGGPLTLFEVERREVTVAFDGGEVVTDTGLLAIRQLDQRLGVLAEAAARLTCFRFFGQCDCLFWTAHEEPTALLGRSSSYRSEFLHQLKTHLAERLVLLRIVEQLALRLIGERLCDQSLPLIEHFVREVGPARHHRDDLLGLLQDSIGFLIECHAPPPVARMMS